MEGKNNPHLYSPSLPPIQAERGLPPQYERTVEAVLDYVGAVLQAEDACIYSI